MDFKKIILENPFLKTPETLFIIGFTGVGKSTFGKQIAHYLNKKFIDLDHAIEQKCEKKIVQIFDENGEEFFRILEREVLLNLDIKNAVIACGGGTPCFFDNLDWMNLNGKTVFLFGQAHSIWPIL